MLLLGLVLCWVLFFISLKSYACVFTESCNLGFFVHSNIFVLDVTKNFGKQGEAERRLLSCKLKCAFPFTVYLLLQQALEAGM